MSSESWKDICTEMSIVRDGRYKSGDWSGYIKAAGLRTRGSPGAGSSTIRMPITVSDTIIQSIGTSAISPRRTFKDSWAVM